MAQKKKNGQQSKGMYHRICHAARPLRGIIGRISHKTQASENPAPGLITPTAREPCGKNIQIDNGSKSGKSAMKKRGQPEAVKTQPEKVGPVKHKMPDNVSFARAKSKDDDSMHEAKFSDYIARVKNRMMKTVSHVGGRGQKDSFNDKARVATSVSRK